jgi:hypothetical protein
VGAVPSEAAGSDADAESACAAIAPSLSGGSSVGATVVGAFDATAAQMAAWHMEGLRSVNAADMYLNEPPDTHHVLCYLDRPNQNPTKQHDWPVTRLVVDVGQPQSLMVQGPSTGIPIRDPATVRRPVVECSRFPKEQCDRLVQTALEGDSTSYVGVSVERYIAPCVTAGLCQFWTSGFGATHVVSAIAPGVSKTRVCNDVPETPTTCRQPTSDEIGPLARLSIELEGAERQDVYLHSGGGISWTAVEGQHLDLMSGTWVLSSPDSRCDGCLVLTPHWTGPQRPGWCSTAFTVASGDAVTVRIRVHPHGSCSMDRVPAAGANGETRLRGA